MTEQHLYDKLQSATLFGEKVALVLIGAIGYGIGILLLATAALKWIFPSPIGLWVGGGFFYFGLRSSEQSEARDLYMPLAFGLGCLFLLVTRHGIRRLLAHSSTTNDRVRLSALKAVLTVVPAYCLLPIAYCLLIVRARAFHS